VSAPRHPDGDAWFPSPSTFSWGWSVPAEILEPLLRPAAPGDALRDADVRSADGRDAEHPAG
jgi:hypothetical protein